MAKTTVINIRDAPHGWENDEQYVYIGRGGKGHAGTFGNPYHIPRDGNRKTVIALYRNYLYRRLFTEPDFYNAVEDLRGKTLVCFCKPEHCHGDVLVEWLEGMEHGREADNDVEPPCAT